MPIVTMGKGGMSRYYIRLIKIDELNTLLEIL